jgi:hypothetical protein
MRPKKKIEIIKTSKKYFILAGLGGWSLKGSADGVLLIGRFWPGNSPHNTDSDYRRQQENRN